VLVEHETTDLVARGSSEPSSDVFNEVRWRKQYRWARGEIQ